MKTLPATLLLAGCLSVPNTPQPQCMSNADCTSGEVCDEGLCWGNPPPGPFAATLAPSSDRSDLVPTELPTLNVPQDGWMGALVLDSSVTISGRVEAFCSMSPCDGISVAAKIVVTRPSLFPGGPGFSASVVAKGGVARGGESFSIQVPRTEQGDAPYIMTILPDGRAEAPPADGSTAPAELVPPARMTVVALDDFSTTITLGSDQSQTITGMLVDSAAHPIKNFRVVAFGQLDAAGPIQEVSTIAYSADGQYSLTLADGIVGTVDLVATSYDTTTLAPTMRLSGVLPMTSTHVLTQPANLGNPLPVMLTIEGVAVGGEVSPVSGVLVHVRATTTAVTNANATTELAVDVTTGDDGVAHLTLLDGTAFSGYRIDAVPPASSNYGAIYDAIYDLALGQYTLRLPRRVALSGVVVDARGKPLSNVTVTARPSLRFSWSLDTAPQAFLAEIPASTAITPNDGGFVVWVDPTIAGVWGAYDLEFDPPMSAGAPSWTQTGVVIPAVTDQTTVSLQNVTIPDPALIHGQITDDSGTPVVGGELRVFQPQMDPSLCGLAHAPADCAIPALLVGHGTSDDTGTVRLTLPRP